MEKKVLAKTNYPIALMLAAVALLVIATTLQASKLDDRIESSGRQSYVFKTYLKGDNIKIDAEDGVVTLTGTVSEESHKSLAQETVASLPGVKKVDNKLEVKGDRSSENSDWWLKAKVKTMFLFHRNVNANTDVDIKDGVVILRGKAESEAQKELTTEYVKDVEGVKEVRNEMTSPASTKATKASKKTHDDLREMIDDASITAQVKYALLSHRSTSALNTNQDGPRGRHVERQGKERS